MSKQALFATRGKFKVAKVELDPDLTDLVGGADFYVREMTAAQSGQIEAGRLVTSGEGEEAKAKYDMSQDRPRVIVRCLCDADGVRCLEDDDELAVAELPRRIVDAIYEQALAVNGMRLEDRKRAKKNSVAASALPIASPSPSAA